MTMRLKRSLILLGALFAIAPTPACDGPVEKAVDRHRVCQRYATCFDDTYDISGCEDRCRQTANRDAGHQNDVDACEACIDDMSGASATFNCANHCTSVVP